MDHPDTETLLDGLEGRLDDGSAAVLRTHLEGCADCAAESRTLGRILAALAAPSLEAPPRAVLERAVEVARPPAAGVVETLAALVFDSWRQGAVAGLRGALPARQLSARTPDFDVHLSLDADAGRIRGQLLPRGDDEDPAFEAALLDAEGTPFAHADPDEFGEFVVAARVADTAAVAFRLADGRVLRCEVPSAPPPSTPSTSGVPSE